MSSRIQDARFATDTGRSAGGEVEALRARCEALEQAALERSGLLVDMSHELRTPLSAIIGFAEILAQGGVGPLAQEHLEFVSDILSSGRHLMTLVNEVLDLAKLEAGRLDLRPAPIPLDLALVAARDAVRAAAQARRVEVVVEGSAGEVLFDPQRLAQSLAALAGYAVRASPEGGRVVLHAESERSGARLEVRTSAPPLGAAGRARLFSTYAAPAKGAPAGEGGLGLALPLARRYIEAHGGAVGVVEGPAPARSPVVFAILPRAERRRPNVA